MLTSRRSLLRQESQRNEPSRSKPRLPTIPEGRLDGSRFVQRRDDVERVPYTKGAALLKRIEELYGRARFDRFLTSWFDGHAFRSVTTDMFIAYLERELFAKDAKLAAQLDLRAWLDDPGLPSDLPLPPSPALELVDRQVAHWKETKDIAALDTKDFVTQQWLHLLEGIAGAIDARSMAQLDARLHLTAVKNCEIADVWLRLAIQHGYRTADARLDEFLLTIGRRKFLEPLYKELAKTPDGLARAKTIYAKARGGYHAMTRDTIDEVLAWPK